VRDSLDDEEACAEPVATLLQLGVAVG